MSDDEKGADRSGDESGREGPNDNDGKGGIDNGNAIAGNKDGDHGWGRDDEQPDRPSMDSDRDLQPTRATRAAYEDGRELLSPEKLAAVRDAFVYFDQRVVPGLRGTSAAPGPVQAEQIDQLRDVYVPVPGYDKMRRALHDRRLVVLVGTRGSGRSTTGLSLLDELTDGQVARLDPAARPMLPGVEQVAVAHGYLGCLDIDPAPSRVAADRLAADLAAKGSYCVLTAHPSPVLRRELGFYCVDHEQADAVEILGRHVQAGVEPDDDDALPGRVAELADSPEITALLGGAARPSEAARAAGLVLAHGRAELSREQANTLITRMVLDDRIEEWFSVLAGVTRGPAADRARRLTAIRIAVAVFDGLPRHIAESAAEPLAARMAMPPRAPDDTVGARQLTIPPTSSRGVDPEESVTLLATTAIKVTPGMVPFGPREVPGETISYRDDRLPSAVLRYVWQHHYALREPMVSWLDDLSRNERSEVRFRAAQAAGLLGALDFTYTLAALIQPAAEACPPNKRSSAAPRSEEADDQEDDEDEEERPDRRREQERQAERDRVHRWRRQFAAIAMDHAARDDQLARLIRSTLRRWRRSKDPALRWTAAFAYGYDIGARDPDLALEELRVLGTPWEMLPHRKKLKRDQFRMEESVFHAAGTSVATLFGSGAHREVLAVLREWSDHPRWSVRLLALQAIVVLTSTIASTVGTPESGGTPGLQNPEEHGSLLEPPDRVARARWPVLVALHERQPEMQRQGAELIRIGLRSRDQKVVLKEFEDIFSIAEEDPEAALPAVEAFLPLVIKEESDRNRLLGLLHYMRGTWADPLSPDIADRLEEFIHGIPVMTGKKVFS